MMNMYKLRGGAGFTVEEFEDLQLRARSLVIASRFKQGGQGPSIVLREGQDAVR